MRKSIFALAVVLLVALAGGLLLLPRQVTVSASVAIHTPSAAVRRCLTQKEQWDKWWPHHATGLQYREQNFSADPMNSLLVRVPVQDSVASSLIMPIGVTRDSTIVTWTTFLPPSANPAQRLRNWMQARRLKGEFRQVLTRLKAFAEKPENLYGFSVKEGRVKDPYLVAIKDSSKTYPSTEAVYAQVERLQAYIRSAGAREAGSPMLHVGTSDSSTYSYMVALPVDRLLPDHGAIKQKRMVLGQILEAEVRGGDYTVRRGMAALQDYVEDYKRQSPAIPYASLTTDRTREPDTTKWITRLYYPVF
jgi:hypothetical protein